MSKIQSSKAYRYDVVIKLSDTTIRDIADICEKVTNKWLLQIEKDSEGNEYYRGRVALKVKVREKGVIKLFHPIKVEVKRTEGGEFYTIESKTIMGGPWTDKNPCTITEARFRDMRDWSPYQKHIIDNVKTKESNNTINIVISNDPKHHFSFATMGAHLVYSRVAGLIAYHMDTENIEFIVKKGYPAYTIDMSRSPSIINMEDFFVMINKIKHNSLISKISSSVKGKGSNVAHAVDTHYPHIWILIHNIPHREQLDSLRGKLWTITPTSEGECLREVDHISLV